MSIAHTVRMFLDNHQVSYEVVSHPRSLTSRRAAGSASIEAAQIEDRVLVAIRLDFEAGEHEPLVHVKTQDFATALAECATGRFSR